MNALRTLGFTMVVVALGLAEAAAAPIPLSTCQTIDKPGSYLVVNNLVATGTCFSVTASHMTIDFGGWLITCL